MAGLIKRLTCTLRRSTPGITSFKLFSQAHETLCIGSKYSTVRSCYSSHHILVKHKSCVFSFHRGYVSSPHIVAFKLSDIGEGIREVTVKEWFVKVGDKVSQFDNICEVQSDKASVTITSRYDGTITKLHYNIDDIALVGDPLVDLEVLDHCTEPEKSEAPEVRRESPKDVKIFESSSGDKILATPAVRRFAQEQKVDLLKLKGSGKHGRVLKEDIIEYLQDERKTQPSSESPKTLPPTIPVDANLNARIEPIRGFARTMVKTMTAANMIPHFVYSDEVDVTKISEVIQQLKKEQSTVKFTFMPFFIKAISKCLSEYPILNSSVDEKCENIIYKTSHNIGVAMDTPAGLIVPNIKRVELLSIVEIARELSRLHGDGLSGSLQPSDLSGGTFTLSNIGTIGGTYTKPVILPPEVAIGAIGSIQIVPRFDSIDNIVKTKIMCVSWAADHRIIDGATMAKFSNMWKNYLQNPLKLILNL